VSQSFIFVFFLSLEWHQVAKHRYARKNILFQIRENNKKLKTKVGNNSKAKKEIVKLCICTIQKLIFGHFQDEGQTKSNYFILCFSGCQL
jgi:hypothetical protein